jgi:hypothetical protein
LAARGTPLSAAILTRVVDFGIQIEIGIGIDGQAGNSIPIPIAMTMTIRIRIMIEALAAPLQAPVSGSSVQVSGRRNIVWFFLTPET